MYRPESGSSRWMSATRPAMLFSTGIIASSAAPDVTASKASSNVGQGSGVIAGYFSRHAASEFAPGSP